MLNSRELSHKLSTEDLWTSSKVTMRLFLITAFKSFEFFSNVIFMLVLINKCFQAN